MEDRVNEDRKKSCNSVTTIENIKCAAVEDKTNSIDSINNNFISGLFEKFNSFHSTKIESDENSLPSPKAMLETIMPCENICNNFRQIADQYDALKTIIKTEMSEKKVSCEFNYEKSHFPINLKSRCQQESESKSKSNMEKLDNQDEDYDRCESPKTKRIYLESHESSSQQQIHSAKMNKHNKTSENHKLIPMPSSPCHSSPSSTSSISSTLNIHHHQQKQQQMMADQCLNGSMEDISIPNISHSQKSQHRENVIPNLSQQQRSLGLGGSHSNLLTSGLPQMNMGLAQSPQMPQLVLANGHLSQGIQGAQVLIPTSQGITSQTILTIPVSQQLPTNLTIDHLIQVLSTISQKQQAAENNVNTNHVLSNVPNLSPNPILLNSHLLATGAQQLLTIQPQLLALQQNHQQMQQQQQQSQDSFMRKMHQNHLENFDLNSVPHSRKDQMNLHMKMRNREMNKRLCNRMGGRPPMNGNNEMNFYEHFESRSPIYSPSNIPTNGDSQINSAKSSQHNKESGTCISPSPPPSQSHHHHSSKLQSPSSSKVMQNQSVMQDLLTESNSCQESQMKTERNSPAENCLKSSKNNDDKHIESSERTSTSPDNQTANILSPSHHFSNDSNSGDANHHDQTNNNQQTNEDIDLDEINEFAQAFKLQRLSLGLTQTQVGQALSVSEGPAYSQSAICSALAARMYAAVQLSSQQQQQQQQQMFEKLDITPKSAQKIKPVLEQWMKEAKGRFKMGENPMNDFMGVETSKKRKRRTSFTPHALEILNSSFERNTHPSGTDITSLAQALGYEREVIRIWFCNKRQALKNTVRMMSKGMSN